MLLDPRSRKRQAGLEEIHSVLNDKTLPTEIRKALETIWRYVDSQNKLKLATTRNYMRYSCNIIKKLQVHPKKWTVETP
ncbi:MAG: hypothetical protein ACFFEE_02340 [Candidatus Thorarchaeota archaeon]